MDEVMHWSQQRSVKACTVDCMRALDCSESRNVLNSFWSASDRFWLMTATKTTPPAYGTQTLRRVSKYDT